MGSGRLGAGRRRRRRNGCISFIKTVQRPQSFVSVYAFVSANKYVILELLIVETFESLLTHSLKMIV